MRELPPRARLYLGAVLCAATLLALLGSLFTPVRLSSAPTAAILLVCAAIAQQFKVKSPKHQSYYTTSIFFMAAAVLLEPLYVVAIVAATHGAEALRVRQRWYIRAFNVANFTISSVAAGSIFRLVVGQRLTLGPATLLAAATAGIAFVLLNHSFTALVIMWARGVPLSRTGTLDWDNLGTDLALMSVGMLGGLLWLSDPWLCPLAVCPLFLIYRSLMVPTLMEEARTDTKTSLANMKHWNEVALLEIQRARRFGRPLSVVLADLDLLREINNRYGHLVGDQMIRRVAEAIRGAVREYDLPARFGGDEFVILMPEATPEEAGAVSERIRRAVAAIELKAGESTRVAATVSIGLSSYPHDGRTSSQLLAAADRAVYQAKALGRNRISSFSGDGPQAASPRAAARRSA